MNESKRSGRDPMRRPFAELVLVYIKCIELLGSEAFGYSHCYIKLTT